MITCRDIKDKFGVSLGTASKILEMAVEIDGQPTEDYWRDLAERAAPHFPRCKGLQNYLARVQAAQSSKSKGKKSQSKKRKSSGKSRQSKSSQKQTGPKQSYTTSATSDSPDVPPSADVSQLDSNDDTAYFQEAAQTLRRLTVKTGRWMERRLEADTDQDYAQVMQVTEKLQKLQAELRQTETKLLEIRKERAELWPRKDVLASVGEVWVVCRGVMDKMIGRLVDLENLPAWLNEVGGHLPEGREPRQRLQQRIRDFISRDANALKESLEQCAVPSEDFSEEVQKECREELAQELEKIVERLRK